MPYLYEAEGPIICRFIWWKLKYETGRWRSYTTSNGRYVGTFWYRGTACETSVSSGWR